MPEEKPARLGFVLLNRANGEETPVETLHVEDGDLLILRTASHPHPEAMRAIRDAFKDIGRRVLIMAAPPDMEMTAMRRAELEGYYAYLSKHLEETSDL